MNWYRIAMTTVVTGVILAAWLYINCLIYGQTQFSILNVLFAFIVAFRGCRNMEG